MENAGKSPKCILVTGVAGFIGSHLLDRLLTEGFRVVGIDDLSRGSMNNIAHHAEDPAFRFLKRDVTDPDSFKDIAENIHCVVHLASYKIPRYGGALSTLRVNSKGCENVLEFARSKSCKCVLASTSDVYGRSPKLPFCEDDESVFGSAKVARWSYAVSKLFTEHLGFAYQETYGIAVTVLRFFGSYGPRHHLSWWGGPQSVFIDAILKDHEVPIHGDGLQTRTFTFVADTVEGIIAAMTRTEANGEILNLGSTQEITILELARTIHRLAGTHRPLKLGFIPYESFTSGKYEDVRRRIPDLSRSQQVLGVTAKVALEDGLAETIKWQRLLPHPAVPVHEKPDLRETAAPSR